jgi:hydroxymethylpyrimidine/phosphomethylpyrimidine kinase
MNFLVMLVSCRFSTNVEVVLTPPLLGHWNHGQLEGPYISRESGTGSMFSAVRIGYISDTRKWNKVVVKIKKYVQYSLLYFNGDLLTFRIVQGAQSVKIWRGHCRVFYIGKIFSGMIKRLLSH